MYTLNEKLILWSAFIRSIAVFDSANVKPGTSVDPQTLKHYD